MSSSMPVELNPDVHERVTAYARGGDELAERGEYVAATAEYNRAWNLLPSPKNDWEAATWLLTAIGDACLHSGHLTSARKALEYATTCPGGLGNPFIHLRLGQVYFEQQQLDAAADELTRAYMGGGREIFESENTKYLDFVATRIRM